MSEYEKQMERFGGVHYPDPKPLREQLEELRVANIALARENDRLRESLEGGDIPFEVRRSNGAGLNGGG